ncbi:hypothetical protein [Rhizobium sp. YS-1r]|uniref:hypothetical protein n=1 Tax=Rhizobium sp. YS-1r TaxID=1532558 RepID=UPI00050E7D64|nr:hypothetical protein [Rhizobium sp. YS-1r]KGD95689.1 hypothetical protein JL39_19710 [Rhizobium sp. YS-1r]
MSDDIHKKEIHRIAFTRTEAIMTAIMSLREPLATEKEIGQVGSAYNTVRSIVFDMIEGAYWEGYSSGEDRPQ